MNLTEKLQLSGRPRRHQILPGFGLTMGYTVTYLGLIVLIPLALRGVRYRSVGAALLLRDNLLIYGLGGLIVPFLGIKLVDLMLVALHLA